MPDDKHMTPDEVRYWIARAMRQKSAYCRDKYIEKRYGITPEQYDYQLQQQSGTCAVCHEPPMSRRLQVDVDTVSGKPRGLLCTCCRSIISLCKNNPDTLSAAIEYIRAFESKIKPV